MSNNFKMPEVGQVFKCKLQIAAWSLDMKWPPMQIPVGCCIVFISEAGDPRTSQYIFLCQYGICKSSQWFDVQNFMSCIERVT